MISRWVTVFEGEKFQAKCRKCGRVTWTKADMHQCPSGCHELEQKEAAKVREVARAQPSPQQSLFDIDSGPRRPIYG